MTDAAESEYDAVLVDNIATVGFVELDAIPETTVRIDKVSLVDGDDDLAITKLEHELLIEGTIKGLSGGFPEKEIAATLTLLVVKAAGIGGSLEVSGKIELDGSCKPSGTKFSFKNESNENPKLQMFENRLFGTGVVRPELRVSLPHCTFVHNEKLDTPSFANALDLRVPPRPSWLGSLLELSVDFSHLTEAAREQLMTAGAIRLVVWESDVTKPAPLKLSAYLVYMLQRLRAESGSRGITPLELSPDGLQVRVACSSMQTMKESADKLGFDTAEVREDGLLLGVRQAEVPDPNCLWFETDGSGFITGPGIKNNWSSKNPMNELTRSFGLWEFGGPKSSGFKLAPYLVQRLQELRDECPDIQIHPRAVDAGGMKVTVTSWQKDVSAKTRYETLRKAAQDLGLEAVVEPNPDEPRQLAVAVDRVRADLWSAWLAISGGFISGAKSGGGAFRLSRDFTLGEFLKARAREVGVDKPDDIEEAAVIWTGPTAVAGPLPPTKEPAAGGPFVFELNPYLAEVVQAVRDAYGKEMTPKELDEAGWTVKLTGADPGAMLAAARRVKEHSKHELRFVRKPDGLVITVEKDAFTAAEIPLVKGIKGVDPAKGLDTARYTLGAKGWTIVGPKDGNWETRVTALFTLAEYKKARQADADETGQRAAIARRHAAYAALDEEELASEYACQWYVGCAPLVDTQVHEESFWGRWFGTDPEAYEAETAGVKLVVAQQPETGDYEFSYRMEVCADYSGDAKAKNAFFEVARRNWFASAPKAKLERFALTTVETATHVDLLAVGAISGFDVRFPLKLDIDLWLRGARVFVKQAGVQGVRLSEGRFSRLLHRFGRHGIEEDSLYEAVLALSQNEKRAAEGMFATLAASAGTFTRGDVPMHYVFDYASPLRGFNPRGWFSTDWSRRLICSQESSGTDFARELVGRISRAFFPSP